MCQYICHVWSYFLLAVPLVNIATMHFSWFWDEKWRKKIVFAGIITSRNDVVIFWHKQENVFFSRHKLVYIFTTQHKRCAAYVAWRPNGMNGYL